MARTIATITSEIRSRFMADETLAASYGFTTGDDFAATFSKVSLEAIWTYITAVTAWVVESLFDTHKVEVNDIIAAQKPHSLKWYVNKAKGYMHGYPLIEDEDRYDTSGLTDDQITAAQVVAYAAAVEKSVAVYIKVAASGPAQLTDDQLAGLKEYIKEVKDAGVSVSIVNLPADSYRCDLDVYYNPMILNGSGMAADGSYPVKAAIIEFLKSLPFNGEYRNASLVDTLQAIEGVVIPNLKAASAKAAGGSWEVIDVKVYPASGYFAIENEGDLNINYIAYETISD